MQSLLLAVSLAALGVVTGVYVSVWIHDRRIADLTASQYTAMHQMRDKTFRRVMPVLGLGCLGIVVAATLFAVEPGWPRALGLAAVALLVVDIVFTIRRQLPVNQMIQGWTEEALPADWRAMRDRWAAQHNFRTVLALASYGCLIAAILGR